jgi:hypothetical protein
MTMVTRGRSISAVVAAISSALVLSSAVSAAFGPPVLLRESSVIRIQDLAARGSTVAVGWREGASPGTLHVRVSTDAGASFRPRYPVAGLGGSGMSLDICRGTVWAATAAAFPGDVENDSDVLVSSRAIQGGAADQVFVTSPADDHAVRDTRVACVGRKLLAIAWLDRTATQTRAVLLRDQDGCCRPPRPTHRPGHRQIRWLAVAATSGVVVAWSRGDTRNLRLRRIDIGSGADPDITPQPPVTLASGDAVLPVLAIRGQKVVLAYSDDGKLKTRISTDEAGLFGSPQVLLSTGSVSRPSRATSVDLEGQRIVVEAMRPLRPGADQLFVPTRIQTQDLGGAWSKLELGNKGPRTGALQRLQSGESRLKEAWHDDGETIDRLRFQREIS